MPNRTVHHVRHVSRRLGFFAFLGLVCTVVQTIAAVIAIL
jgi:hypothetical protein